jgi:CRISP-associated protein Cas1
VASRQGITLLALEYTGKTLAIMQSPRRDEAIEERQRSAVADPHRTLAISRSLIMRKVEAARETLAAICPDAVAAIRQAEISLNELRDNPPQSLSGLRGIEGRVAVAYFAALRPIPIRWTGTRRRPIPDDWRTIGPRPSLPGAGNRDARLPVPAMANFAYALLESRTRVAATAAGLDLDRGFMHGPQRSKMAPRSPLALDLMEPLRPLIDRALLRFATGRAFHPSDFAIAPNGVCRLHPQMARVVVAEVDRELGPISSPACAPRRVVREMVAAL